MLNGGSEALVQLKIDDIVVQPGDHLERLQPLRHIQHMIQLMVIAGTPGHGGVDAHHPRLQLFGGVTDLELVQSVLE